MHVFQTQRRYGSVRRPYGKDPSCAVEDRRICLRHGPSSSTANETVPFFVPDFPPGLHGVLPRGGSFGIRSGSWVTHPFVSIPPYDGGGPVPHTVIDRSADTTVPLHPASEGGSDVAGPPGRSDWETGGTGNQRSRTDVLTRTCRFERSNGRATERSDDDPEIAPDGCGPQPHAFIRLWRPHPSGTLLQDAHAHRRRTGGRTTRCVENEA